MDHFVCMQIHWLTSHGPELAYMLHSESAEVTPRVTKASYTPLMHDHNHHIAIPQQLHESDHVTPAAPSEKAVMAKNDKTVCQWTPHLPNVANVCETIQTIAKRSIIGLLHGQ